MKKNTEKRPEGVREAERATRFARVTVLAAALVAAGAMLLETVHEVLAVPALPPALFQRETYVEFQDFPKEIPDKPKLKEHLVDESEHQIDPKPEPKPEPPPPPKPEPPPPPPPAPKPPPPPPPKPVPKPKPAPKPVPKPAPKAPPKPAPQAEPAPQAQAAVEGLEKGSAKGGAGHGVAGTASVDSGNRRSEALAQILAVVEAHKTYPRRARQTGQQGTVVLSVHVNARGVVDGVEVEKEHSSALLNRAAKNAAKPLMGLQTALKESLRLSIPVRFELH